MIFGVAIEHIKRGDKVAREGWNGKGMYLFLVSSWVRENKPLDVMTGQQFIAMKAADDTVVPWLASQTDMLAEDWRIV